MTTILEPAIFHFWYGSAGGDAELTWDPTARMFLDPTHVWSERIQRAPLAEALERLSGFEAIRSYRNPPYAEFTLHQPSGGDWERFWSALQQMSIWRWQGMNFGRAANVCDSGWRLTIEHGDRALKVAGAQEPGNYIFFLYHLSTLLDRRSRFLDTRSTGGMASRISPSGTTVVSNVQLSSAGWRGIRLDQYDDERQIGSSSVVYSRNETSVHFFHDGRGLQVRVVPRKLSDFETVDSSTSWNEYEVLTASQAILELTADVMMPTDRALERTANRLLDMGHSSEEKVLCSEMQALLTQQY